MIGFTMDLLLCHQQVDHYHIIFLKTLCGQPLVMKAFSHPFIAFQFCQLCWTLPFFIIITSTSSFDDNIMGWSIWACILTILGCIGGIQLGYHVVEGNLPQIFFFNVWGGGESFFAILFWVWVILSFFFFNRGGSCPCFHPSHWFDVFMVVTFNHPKLKGDNGTL